MTTRYILVKISEHSGIFYTTGRNREYNPNKTTAVQEHIRLCKLSSNVDNFTISGQ